MDCACAPPGLMAYGPFGRASNTSSLLETQDVKLPAVAGECGIRGGGKPASAGKWESSCMRWKASGPTIAFMGGPTISLWAVRDQELRLAYQLARRRRCDVTSCR